MHQDQDVISTLTLLAASPIVTQEDRPIVDILIAMANEKTCGEITMLELLTLSQLEGDTESSIYHFKHPLADVLVRELVGDFSVEDHSDQEPFEFQAEFGYYTNTYSAWNGNISIHWEPARFMKLRWLAEKQRERELEEQYARDRLAAERERLAELAAA